MPTAVQVLANQPSAKLSAGSLTPEGQHPGSQNSATLCTTEFGERYWPAALKLGSAVQSRENSKQTQSTPAPQTDSAKRTQFTPRPQTEFAKQTQSAPHSNSAERTQSDSGEGSQPRVTLPLRTSVFACRRYHTFLSE